MNWVYIFQYKAIKHGNATAATLATLLLVAFIFPAWADHKPNHSGGDGSPTATTLTTLGCINEGEVAKIVSGQWVCTVAVGPAGADGATGAQGPIGLTGADGADGAQGPAGADGATGPQGPEGPAGVAGTDGADGADGVDGVDASLPSGADPGDILYWDGSVWQLTPAPTPGCGDPVLTLTNHVPTWSYDMGIYCIGVTGPAGGIVFYVTDGGQHGLEAAPADSANSPWGCKGVSIPGADGTAIGTGALNTHSIVAGCVSAEVTAAEVADNYELNGFDDWFLPSKDELDELFLHKDIVGGGWINNYWSSSEIDVGNAWYQFFFLGDQGPATKDNTLGVRPVRAF